MVNTEMSNLTLKSTNWAKMVEAIKGKRGGEPGMIRLGSNTEAYLVDTADTGDAVDIYYHGNLIAQLGYEGIAFRNAGWSTPTTRNRLGIIARDNDVPLYFGQKNYAQTLYAEKRGEREAYRGSEIGTGDVPLPTRHLITDEFSSIIWNRQGDYITSPAFHIDPFYL